MRSLPCIAFTVLLGAGAPAAAQDSQPDSPEEIKVNAMRDPEVRKYEAIVAGLDAFDEYHRMAPKVPVLQFRVEPRSSAQKPVLPAARLGGDDGFSLALAVDTDGMFIVPRSQAALDANSELVLNQKRRQYRVTPVVRSPGLPGNVRRLGDLRLECRVQVAIIKEEIPLWVVLAANTLLRTRDWCGFTFEGKSGFTFKHTQTLHAAVLVDGNRSALLETEGKGFRVPLGDTSWSDDTLVELEGEPTPTGTAGETPRTAP
ncbi:hypothetical protein [Massilia sp. HP4]|uniref:hypothetical protein n=1 Tax=Massilia sp. HP4 TaxID=2562316 RepID=UPI001E529D46|nr:hypothetical protein [Massilia sp. HP4]